MEEHPMNPYSLRWSYGQTMVEYLTTLIETCNFWGIVIIGGNNNFTTGPRRVDVVLKTVPDLEPWIPAD
ncbi:hypothetical protein SOVF_200020 [Spinacia oleracea]|nr:hypothetical protein SOVF_200020 [Spinacia oleracea]